MKKIYQTPNIECFDVIRGGILCELSGTNDSGSSLVNGNTPGQGTGGSGNLAPRRRVF